jgi:prepilin-type N-terminal cleavage/methylation domain-containing protein
VVRSRRAFSLVESLLVLVIFGIIAYASFALFRTSTKMEDAFSAQIGLQLEAQRALATFLRELQEATSVVHPPPGHTFGHAIIRDGVNRLAVYSLVPAPGRTDFQLRKDLVSPAGTKSTVLLDGVHRITFTALSDAAVMLHLTLGSGSRRYAFHTEVRFRNRDALEGP